MPRTVPRVDVIVNRTAHRLRKAGPDTLRDRIVRTRELGASVHETHTLDDLERVATDIASRAPGTDVVVLCGGDGSYMAGVTALDRATSRAGATMPAIALAPGGTVSTVARNWGMRSRSADAAEAIVARALEGTAGTPAIERPTLRVKDSEGGDRVGFIFGAGLVANFFDVYYALPPSQQGYAGAASIALRVFAGSFVGSALAKRVLAPTPSRLFVDGAAMPPGAWSLVLASVVKDAGLHMLVTHRAAERTDRFHVVASAEPPRALGPQMPRVLAGKPLRGRDHVDTLAADVRLELASPRACYVLDGDPIAARSVSVTPGPMIRVVA